MKVRFLIVCFFLINLSRAEVYFVSPGGSDAYTGTDTLQSWQHISFAAGQLTAGDTVYVKGGIYLYENVILLNDGNAEMPIVFIGYSNDYTKIPDYQFLYGDTILSENIPVMVGISRSNGGIAFNLMDRKYIQIRNFHIKNYEIGIQANNTEKIEIYNIFAQNFGDTNAEYSGKGIVLGSNSTHSIIGNCMVINAAAEGISIKGDYNQAKRCSVYCDDNSTGYKSATDYYILIVGNFNCIDSCYAERIGDLEHVGHGIGMKGACSYNCISNCKSVNFSGGYYVRGSQCHDNLINNCTVFTGFSGILIRDGAYNNKFTDCKISDAINSVTFFTSNEDSLSEYSGINNLISHCILENSKNAVINFYMYKRDLPSVNNTFENCDIRGAKYLVNSDCPNINNKMMNSIVTDIENFNKGPNEVGFEFSYSNFFNTQFNLPIGESITSYHPFYNDTSNSDYSLKSEYGRWNNNNQKWVFDDVTSPLIDAGDIDSPFSNEPESNGNRINLGIYGNTINASKSIPLTEKPYYIVYQNFPNPFTSDTYIIYKLSVNAYIKIFITDLQGRELMVLEDTDRSPGVYEAHFKNENFETGIYFYHFLIGDQIITKEMIIIH